MYIMNNNFSEEAYNQMISALFRRFPSFQKAGAGAYKPGIDNMLFFDQLAGHPHRKYATIHVAGTNGKGSVSNMLASILAACGLKVGLYTSPHILDFRERMRVVKGTLQPGNSVEYISKEDVWNFWQQWGQTADHLDLSFFEITTMMAFDWFAGQDVDVAVIETGLGGRLDSTNIIAPVLSVITNIGLDHCDLLGDTLAEIAFEKAGIIRPCVPVVVGESDPETDAVFERKVLYTNLPEASFAGDRSRIMSLLSFADKMEPRFWGRHRDMLDAMDLQGVYQERNLRTVLAALDVLLSGNCAAAGEYGRLDAGLKALLQCDAAEAIVAGAVENTAKRMDFHGRWEKLCDAPYVICDIGHNAHGLKYNFAQLDGMMSGGRFRELIMVYGSVADKDVDAVLRIFPQRAHCIFTNAEGKRALPAGELKGRYSAVCLESGRPEGDVRVAGTVKEAVEVAFALARNLSADGSCADVLVYIGGSTYVVSEAAALWQLRA